MARVQGSELGFCGIIRKSFHILFSEKKLLSTIAFLFILPLPLVSLALYTVSLVLYNSIAQNNSGSDLTLVLLVLVNLFCILFEIAFYLLSCAAVVYTAACSYTGKPITFHKVTKSLCQIWRRLVITSLWCLLISIIYSLVASIVLTLLAIFVLANTIGLVVFVILLIIYIIGSIYLNMVFGMAFVISVLEEVYGRESIVHGKNLLRGKELVAGSLYVLLAILAGVIQTIFAIPLILSSGNLGFIILQLIVACLVAVLVILLIQVIQTVLYFACKLHRGEDIDETFLSSHLDRYMGLYAPLMTAEVVEP